LLQGIDHGAVGIETDYVETTLHRRGGRVDAQVRHAGEANHRTIHKAAMRTA